MAGASIDSIAAGIVTVGQGRAALGEAARLLSQGYARLADVPRSGAARDSARSLLGQGNAYAKRVYDSLPAAVALQSTRLDPVTQKQVRAALTQADSSLRLVEEVAGQKYWDFAAAMRIVTGAVGGAVGDVAGVAGSAVGSLTGRLLGGLGVVWVVAILIAAALYFAPGKTLGLVRKVAHV